MFSYTPKFLNRLRILARLIYDKKDVLIIGAGPAGVFTAEKILAENPRAHITMFEKRNAPFGLLRYGVAPDNIEIKKYIEKLKPTLKKISLFLSRSFKLTYSNLLRFSKHYKYVILATGAEQAVTHNVIDDSVITGDMFFNFYNGNRDMNECTFLEKMKKAESISIIGSGNVTLDVARIISMGDYRNFDFSPQVTNILSEINPRTINIVTRSSPEMTKFTIPELKNLRDKSKYKIFIENTINADNEVDMSKIQTKKIDFFTNLGLPKPNTTIDKKILFRFSKDTNDWKDDFVIKCLGFRQNDQHRIYTTKYGRSLKSGTRNNISPFDNVFSVGWANTGASGNISQMILDVSSFIKNKVISNIIT